MTTSRRLLRALGALFGLGALVGALPTLLVVVVGWPLPRRLPTPQQVSAALDQGWRPDERFVMGVLAILLWLVWAQVLRHLLAQVRHHRRLQRLAPAGAGVPAVMVAPAPRRGGPLQRLVGWLVGGLMMASPIVPAAALASPPPRIPVVLTVTKALADPLPAPTSSVATAVAPEPELPTYVVHTWAERRDCLWNIAERYLGDPFRWTEIRNLNSDRVQPDGRTLGAEPRSWVYPGWTLVLPADADGADVVPVAVPGVPSVGAPTSAASDPASAPAATRPSSGAASAITVPATTASPAATAVTATSAPATTVASPPRSDAPPASTAAVSSAAEPTPADPAEKAASQEARPVRVNPWAQRAAFAGALGLPVLALGGWLGRLRRGRAVQASVRRPGRDVVRPADPGIEALERRARAIAADQAEEWVDAALRDLTAAVAASALDAPVLRCVRAGELGLEVLLDEPSPLAPDGWDAVDDGHVWRLSPALELAELRERGSGHAALAPALVSLGGTPEGPLLVDVEALGVLGVDGDQGRVRAFLAGVALELASASWAEGVDVRVHGLDGFERLEGAAPDADALRHDVRAAAELAGEGLAPYGSAAAARVAPDSEGWYPTVVVLGPDADPALVEDLAALSGPGTGVAVVAAGAPAAAEWQLLVGPDGAAVLNPLGLALRAGGVDEAPSAGRAPVEPAAGRDVDSADVLPGPEAITVEQTGLDEQVIASAVHALAAVGEVDDVAPATPIVATSRPRLPLRRREDCEVWVSLLRRTPEIIGWADEARGRRKLAEVFVYLAIYGAERPVPSADLRTNCWPPKLDHPATGPARLRDISPEAFHQAMSRLRRQMGEGAGGWHVPVAVDGTYVPGPGVGCDWVLFRALTEAAEGLSRHDSAQAIALYCEALDLIQGEPFVDCAPGSCTWAEANGLVTTIRLAVSEAVAHLAKLALPSQPKLALEGARKGLLLLPTQLQLFDTWFHAAGELGDLAVLDQALEAKSWAEQQINPDGGVSPETMELYRRLKAKINAGADMVGARSS